MPVSRALRFRMAASEDMQYCLSMVRSLEALPENLFRAVPKIWEANFERLIFNVVEDQEQANQPGCIRAFGLSVAVKEDFSQEVLATPQGPLAHRFYSRMMAGEDLVLRDGEIGERHAGNGVDIAVLHFLSADSIAPGMPSSDVLRHGMASFLTSHGGFRLRTLLFDAHSMPAAAVLGQAGFRSVHNAAAPPYLMSMQKEHTQPGLDPINQLFYTPAGRLFFSHAERRLLERAVFGQKDAEIAQALCVSPDTVKKTWQNIFSRVAKELPVIFETSAAKEGVRGPEKRTRVMEYVRAHPEELRPWVRPAA